MTTGAQAPPSRAWRFTHSAALLLLGFFLGLGLGRRIRMAEPATVAVHITGAVAKPGLYELPAGTRMAAALEVAGTLPDADLEAVNLAERLFDGQRVILPSRTRGPGPAPAPAPAQASGGKPPPGRTLIDLNTAGAELLESLPGIGEVKAAAILAWRQENGAFSSIDDLTLVSGIGPITLERVRPLVTVGRR